MELSLAELKAIIEAAELRGRLSVVTPEVVKGGWDESQHPRGDDGRFINKGEISQAASNPAKAAELRSKVTDPKERSKLDAAIKGQQTGFAQGLGKIPAKLNSSRQPASTATTGEHSAGTSPSVQETVDLVRGIKNGVMGQEQRKQLAERIAEHSAEELKQVKSELGLNGGGRKADLATRILLAADGKSYPEEGFTGALPMRNGSVRHYEDGQIVRIEKNDGSHESRVTPDEAHAAIEQLTQSGKILTPEGRQQIAHMLMHRMSYRDIRELKNKLGLKASGKKAVFAERIQRLVEDKERRARQNPDHPANQPDPAGHLNNLQERLDYIQRNQATYGAGKVSPERQKTVDEAADRLRMALDSPFAAFSPESALGEAKEAVNDLYSTQEFLAAAHLANLPLDAKDGKPMQQVAAAIYKLSRAKQGVHDGEQPTPGQSASVADQGTSNVANHTHYVSGDTYPHREAIKKAGGTWDKVAKRWTIDEHGASLLPDGLKAEPLDHRMPKTGETTKNPAESKSIADVVAPTPAPAPSPTVPESAIKEAEELKKWHQRSSRHEVEYAQMKPWDAQMMRKSDAEMREWASKKMGQLFRKHPDLAADYGHYISKNPILPKVPTAEEHLAKYGSDATPQQIVNDYVAQGGHPKDLYEHLNPENLPAGQTRSRTSVYRDIATNFNAASGHAANAIGEHLKSKAAGSIGNEQQTGATVNDIAATRSALPAGMAGAPSVSGGNDTPNSKVADSPAAPANKPKRSNVITDPERIAELERESSQRDTDLRQTRTYEGRVEKEQQEREANLKNPEWIKKQIQQEKDHYARISGGGNKFSGNNSADYAMHQQRVKELEAAYAASTGQRGTDAAVANGNAGGIDSPPKDRSTSGSEMAGVNRQELGGIRQANGDIGVSPSIRVPDPAPNRTEHLDKVAASADREALRDAADTVSRVEDIPVGERTADDRAELKQAKELAAANEVSKPTVQRLPDSNISDKAETGNAFLDYVPTAKKVESDEDRAVKKAKADKDLEEAFGMKTVATRDKEAAEGKQQPKAAHEMTRSEFKAAHTAEKVGKGVYKVKNTVTGKERTVYDSNPAAAVWTAHKNAVRDQLEKDHKQVPLAVKKEYSVLAGKYLKDPDAPDTSTHGKRGGEYDPSHQKKSFRKPTAPVESKVFELYL